MEWKAGRKCLDVLEFFKGEGIGQTPSRVTWLPWKFQYLQDYWKKIPYSLILVQQHVVNLLWQVFTIPFVCFLWIFWGIMFDERDSVPNSFANMYLWEKYLHGDLESWDFSCTNRVNPCQETENGKKLFHHSI